MKSTRPPKLSESRLTGSFISANTNKDAAGTSVSSQSGLLKELKTLDKLERPRRVKERGQVRKVVPQITMLYSNMHVCGYWPSLLR